MTDNMNEAKRLAQAYADAVLLGEGNDEALAVLLAHIQRDAGVEVGESVTCEQCGHENWIMYGKAPAQITAADMLAAAPAPDQFRDAAKMMAAPAEAPDGWEYYYKDNDCPAADSGDPNCICWYDEGRGPYNNARHDDEDTFLEWRRVKAAAPAEVPMPEPDVTALWNYTDSSGEGHSLAYTHDQMRTYGAAREAAGYARAANWLRAKAEKHAEENGYHEPDTGAFVFAGRAAEEWNNSVLELADEMEAALRGEVKP